MQRVLEIMTGQRRERDDALQTCCTQLFYCFDGCVDFGEDAEQSVFLFISVCHNQSPDPSAFAMRRRRGMGKTSFSSCTDTAGNTRRKSRNHMKNHAKLPTM